MNTSIVLRPSTLADVPLLERWDRQPHVISATTDDPTAEKAFEGAYWPDELAAQDEHNQYLIAELDGRPIGACFADPAVTAIVVDPLVSNARAHKFYQRLGFKAVGRRRFGGDDCLVHELRREDWRAEFADDAAARPVGPDPAKRPAI